MKSKKRKIICNFVFCFGIYLPLLLFFVTLILLDALINELGLEVPVAEG